MTGAWESVWRPAPVACLWCGRTFVQRTQWHAYCGQSCKKAAKRRRNANELVALRAEKRERGA